MPSRKSYQIANRDEGKAAQRDQSYKSCVITLLIFFFLCIILILAGIPWRRNGVQYSEREEDNLGTAQQHHREHHTEMTRSTESYSDPVTSPSKPSEPEVFEEATQKSYIVNANNSSKFERLLNTESTTEKEATTVSVTDTDSVTDETLHLDSSTIDPNSLPEEFSSSTVYSTSTSEEYSTVNVTEVEISSTKPSTSTEPSTSTKPSTSTEPSTSTDLYFVTNETTTDSSVTTETDEHVTIKSTSDFTTEKMLNTDTTTITPVITTSDRPFEEEICMTGECKSLASRMLFFMNHTADPCDGFYEYACGGFETNPQTVDRNLEDEALQRILRQMKKDYRQHRDQSSFFKYYRSCLAYANVNYTERIRLAKGALEKVGRFYTYEEWAKNHTKFTELLAKLLLHNSALLFDVSPDFNEINPQHLTLKISPTTYKNPFDTDKTEDPCYEDQTRDTEVGTVDLGKVYQKYESCRNDTTEYIQSISEALRALGVFSELSNPYNITQYIDTTIINIDFELVQKFFQGYPPKNKIRLAYAEKDYTRVSMEELDRQDKIVNWTQLIYLLTHQKIMPEVEVQVYFYEALVQGLKSLAEFEARDAMALNNAVLGLYAHSLYHDLVLSKPRDPKKHCLRVASNLLIPEASSLYMSSFSNDEHAYMSNITRYLFEEQKETLKLRIKEVYPVEEGNALIAKVDHMEVAVPHISYFKESNSTYRKTIASEETLSDNYFKNSVALMKRYRKLIYATLFTNPGHPEQIWTHYSTPFQSKGLAIYGLNLVVIPFGVIDWSEKHDDLSFDYMIIATLGNVIAHQIAHHFDANGNHYYWNGTRDNNYSLLNDHDFDSYISCQENLLYENPMEMTLPSTGQTVSYEISKLTLNERLSETMGLRLAKDTFDRLRSRKEVLPWLNLDSEQLFYLTYAQMHCTKTPLTSSYISLYEDEQLPSRIRVFVSTSNNRLLGEAWNCREGSQLIPSTHCDVFPSYSQFDDGGSTPARRK